MTSFFSSHNDGGLGICDSEKKQSRNKICFAMNQLSLMTFTPDLKVCLSSVKRFLSRIRTHNFRASLGFEPRKPFDCHTAVSFFFSIVHQTFRSSDTKAWCKLQIIIIQHFESPSTILASKASSDQQKLVLVDLVKTFCTAHAC